MVIQRIIWSSEFIAVLLLSAGDASQDSQNNPIKAYTRERLQMWKDNRKLMQEAMAPQIFSLGLKSVYKHDQVSWLGICWRSFLIAGISIYNVWFWFTGIAKLAQDGYPTYIFLFYKASIDGGAGIVYKALSIAYMIYGGVVFLICLTLMLAFVKTTIRSICINFLIIPYARLVLVLASAGIKTAERMLDRFNEAQSELLKMLGVPNMRQLLCGFAYLSSNPGESNLPENSGQEEDSITHTEKTKPW